MAKHRVKRGGKKHSKHGKGLKVHGGFKAMEHKKSRKRG